MGTFAKTIPFPLRREWVVGRACFHCSAPVFLNYGYYYVMKGHYSESSSHHPQCGLVFRRELLPKLSPGRGSSGDLFSSFSSSLFLVWPSLPTYQQSFIMEGEVVVDSGRTVLFHVVSM